MNLSKTKEFVLRHLTEIEAAVFFLVYYLSVLLIIEPELIYHSYGRVLYYYPFVMDSRFLYDCLTTVGGPVNYLTGFFNQCFYFSWIGSLIITAIGWLLWLLSRKAFAVTRSSCITEICFLFPILLLASYASYGNQRLIALSMLSVFAAFVLYMWTNLSKSLFTAMLFLAESACLYYLIGRAAFIFGLLAGFYELLVKKRIALAGGIFALLALYYYTRVNSGNVSNEVPLFCLMYVPPFLILLLVAFDKYRQKKTVRSKSQSNKNQPIKKFHFAMLIVRKMIPYGLILFIFCAVLNDKAKSSLKICFYADKQNWQKVLEYAKQHPESQYNLFSSYDINRALYYTGQLGDDMFSYYQHPFALLLSVPDSNPTYSYTLHLKVRKMDVLMELGHLGHAKRFGLDALELANGCPYLVKKQALIYLAEGQNDIAKIFLGALSKDLIYGRFARQLLLRLENDPQLTDYEPVQYLRSVAVRTDHIGDYDLDDFFVSLLQQNPHNKMAFEYMMAMYLLTGRVDKIALNISRMDEFEYKKTPRHYEEAMLIYVAWRQQRFGEKIKVQELPISSETMKRYQEYNATARLLSSQKMNPEMIRQSLAKDFGDTYMFYFDFKLPRAGK